MCHPGRKLLWSKAPEQLASEALDATQRGMPHTQLGIWRIVGGCWMGMRGHPMLGRIIGVSAIVSLLTLCDASSKGFL